MIGRNHGEQTACLRLQAYQQRLRRMCSRYWAETLSGIRIPSAKPVEIEPPTRPKLIQRRHNDDEHEKRGTERRIDHRDKR